MTNTQSLGGATPALALQSQVVPVETYGIPPLSEQKAGAFPLGQCVNDTTIPTPAGPGCWRFFFATEPAHNEVESHLDSNDTRMQQVVYAAGHLWGALDTIVNVGGVNKAGIAWFAITPVVTSNGKVIGTPAQQGYVAVANNNITYPAIAVLPSGKGVMAFTLVGTDHFPSAAYAPIDLGGVGDIHVAAVGIGPDDGATSYKAIVGDPPRTRWGDYGAAVVEGNSIWLASEYIGQTCTLGQYTTAPLGSCGGTRARIAGENTAQDP
ncbi:MAG: hypothetical protein LC793_16105 [Thermomicrobia bacterium]|nr:hypothetical protein [Thermomicrobia bacterium]